MGCQVSKRRVDKQKGFVRQQRDQVQYDSHFGLIDAASNLLLHGIVIEKSVGNFNRKSNFLLFTDYSSIQKTVKRKSFNFEKSHELICHFIRGYLVPLPPYKISTKFILVKVFCILFVKGYNWCFFPWFTTKIFQLDIFMHCLSTRWRSFTSRPLQSFVYYEGQLWNQKINME